MKHLHNLDDIQFYSIGISYKKSDAEIRGLFSVTAENQIELLTKAKKLGCKSVLLISTCNRTELYGFVSNADILLDLLVEFSNGDIALLKENAFVHENKKAVNHLFKVGCGLDSQIIGDFEVIGQVKKSYQQSLAVGTTDVFLDRLINSVIQASRKVKVETQLSSGVTSVSFAGVQYIRSQFKDLNNKKILLYGTGKLGRNTCENLIKHSSHDSITLINRNQEKAEVLAHKFDVSVKKHDLLNQEISNTDILFVATGAPEPTINLSNITHNLPLLILDLSIPRNVHPDVANHPNVTLVHMDELSQLTNETLKNREENLPKAYAVMDELQKDFFEWVSSRKMVPTLNALNIKLKQYKDSELQKVMKEIGADNQELMMLLTDKIVRKLTGNFAGYLRNNSTDFEKDLSFIHQVFKLDEVQKND